MKTETSSEKPKRKYTRKANVTNPEFRQEDAGGFPKGLSEGGKELLKQMVSGEPPKTISEGDKTPAYVEWYRKNHSKEEFDSKYGNRKFGEAE